MKNRSIVLYNQQLYLAIEYVVDIFILIPMNVYLHSIVKEDIDIEKFDILELENLSNATSSQLYQTSKDNISAFSEEFAIADYKKVFPTNSIIVNI